MKLYGSYTSPYARKVRALIIETGLSEKVEMVPQDPRKNNGGYHKKYPLARVPALETDNGMVLFDSPVICEYLDSLHKGRKMFPAQGAARWKALKQQALADGMLDCAVPLRMELMRPSRQQSPDFVESRQASIKRTVDALEQAAKAGELGQSSNIGTLAIASALGYLDFRYGALGWRRRHSSLSKWFDKFATRRSMTDTAPPK